MKRTISTLLLIAMLATSLVLASCSSGDDASTAETTTAASVDTTAAAETTAPPEYVSPGIDYDGREFIFGSYVQENSFWVSCTYAEAYSEAENGDAINDGIYKRRIATEEELGIVIKPANFDDISKMTTAVLAGDRFADTTIMTGNQGVTVQNQDLALDLFTLDSLDLERSWWNQNCIENYSIANKLYAAAGDIAVIGLLAGHCVYVNTDMISDFSLDDPYDAVRGGTWTNDMVREMATVVASDINGDGVMDENDRFGLSSEALGLTKAIASGVMITKKDENDMPTLALDTERAAAAVEQFVSLWRDKSLTLFSSDFSSKYSNVFSDMIFKMFISDRILFINNWLVWTLNLRVMESDYGILPPPKMNEEQDAYYVSMTEGFTTYAVVPVTIDDPEFVGTVMNALGYYGQMYIHPALMDTTVTSKAVRDEDSLEMLELIYDSRYYEPAVLYNYGGISTMFANFISRNKTDFASAYAAIENNVIAAMAKTAE